MSNQFPFRSRRRRLLKGLVGAGAVALARPVLAGQRLKVGIVGGGIVGASIAMQLAEAGADVVLFEKSAPASGATRNSFAWLNAFVDDRQYRDLRIRSLAAWHALDARLGLGVVWGGYLNWAGSEPEAHFVRHTAEQLSGTHAPARLLTADDFAALAPGIAPGRIVEALYSSMDGHVDPVRATEAFLVRAQARGARVLHPCELQGLEFRNGRLTAARTSAGETALDRLVVAAGVATPRILSMAGFDLRLRHAPGFLMHSSPVSEQTKCVCDAPGGVSFKQMADGALVATDSPEPPDTSPHAAIREHAIDFTDEALRALHGERVLGKVKAFLPHAKDARLARVALGFRPMPTDGLPVLGPLPGNADVYVAVMHSGVTLAPIVGEVVRAELLEGRPVDALAPYRPARFQ